MLDMSVIRSDRARDMDMLVRNGFIDKSSRAALLDFIDILGRYGRVVVAPVPDSVTAVDAARLMGLPRNEFIELANEEDVHHVMRGHHAMYAAEDVLALMANHGLDSLPSGGVR